jgi:trans-aconitate methyltransferase
VATSLIYRSGLGYELVMMALYRRHYSARYQAIADLIPQQAEVLELCCGPGILYQRYLRRKNVRYRGLDMNEKFVEQLMRHGVASERWDLRRNHALPRADYVIMQASLYHFLPNAGGMLDRMFEAARKAVIVAEPIRNLACSRLPWMADLARKLTDPGSGAQENRFVEKSLDELAQRYGGPRQAFLTPGGREKVYVFEKDRHDT